VSESHHTITSAQRALSDEQSGRTRKYLISMGIRTACVIGAIFIPGWPRWVLIAGAVVLPYLAVVIANGGKQRDTGAPDEVTPQAQAALPASGTAIEGVVIVPGDDNVVR
jgi:type III secretory pathway component EscV